MKRGTDLKLKFKLLQRRLGLATWELKGLLQALWDFTAENAALGDIGRICDDEIAIGIEWSRTTGTELIEALVETRWVDRHAQHRLVIHDWHEHVEEWLRKRVRRAGQTFATEPFPVADNGRQRLPLSDNGCPPEPEPEPEPKEKNTSPAAPSLAELKSDFAKWYEPYPHKVGRRKAEAEYILARKRGVTQAELVDGLARYIRDKPPDRPWCNPATWLHQGRWEDEPAEVQPPEEQDPWAGYDHFEYCPRCERNHRTSPNPEKCPLEEDA